MNKHKSRLSRRDALKLSALLASTPLWAGEANQTEETFTKVTTRARIVIVGGGDAGITIAARLAKILDASNITIIEPHTVHYYQPGQTLVAGGVWELEDITYETQSYIPQGVQWIKQKAVQFQPDRNCVIVEDGQEIMYDYMVLSTGLSLRFDRIEGLAFEDFSKEGMYSIYDAALSARVFEGLKTLAQKAKTQKVQALFTHPNTHIKCGGAPKKIMFLAHDYLKEQGVRENVTMTFFTPGNSYFGIEPYDTAVDQLFKEKNMHIRFRHDLKSIDTTSNTATFEHMAEVQGEWDEDLEEYDTTLQPTNVTQAFDFIHITPPMQAADAVKASPLAWQKGSNGAMGLIEVDEYTLQHKRYPNVFGAGDVIGTRFGKTGGSARKQAPIVVRNIVRLIEGKIPDALYDGYTVCPIITGYGKVLLAEFGYEGVQTTFPLDPAQERWIWWLLKVYGLKTMYFNGMLKGRM